MPHASSASSQEANGAGGASGGYPSTSPQKALSRAGSAQSKVTWTCLIVLMSVVRCVRWQGGGGKAGLKRSPRRPTTTPPACVSGRRSSGRLHHLAEFLLEVGDLVAQPGRQLELE